MRRFMSCSGCVSEAESRCASLNGLLSIALCVVAATQLTGCNHSDREAPAISFVHASDPLIFLPSTQDPSAKNTQEKQQALDEKALADLFQYIRSFPSAKSGSAEAPGFLVLTGNLGLDPCAIARADTPALEKIVPSKAPPKRPVAAPTKTEPTQTEIAGTCMDLNPDRRKSQIQRLVQTLGSSPLQDIYMVAGFADVAHESPGADALKYFNQLVGDAQSALAAGKSGVRLHNLMRCYAADAPASSCYADIAGSVYRLIGFPSYAFRNQIATANQDSLEADQFEMFRGLVRQAEQADRKALIVTSTPEIDDPFLLAQDRYAGKAPPKANDLPATSDQNQNNPRSPWSTWNVSRKLLDGWRDVLASDSVAGVLAGTLRDSHKEIYGRPYAWSGLNDHRLGFRKLFLAPPLAVAGQDASPIQARGFAWVRAYPDRVVRELYWYNAQNGNFEADSPATLPGAPPQGAPSLLRLRQIFTTFWNLDQVDSSLIRFAILAIAFMAGFLTVVAIWQLPAVDNPLADPRDQKGKDSGQPGPAQDSSPFTSRFGKTVVAGLGGLVFAEIAKTFGNQPPAAEMRWFYIVWFILFFFLCLIVLNLVRAFTESLRVGVAVPRATSSTLSRLFYRGVKWNEFLDTLSSTRLGLFPRRVTWITFFDTFVNLIQGKNQTATRALTGMIVERQRNDLRVAEAIRRELNEFMIDAVERLQKGKAEDSVADRQSRVRVNISVLSADQSDLFYICKSRLSSWQSFSKKSVAWVSAFTGEPLWYTSDYNVHNSIPTGIVLYQNNPRIIEGEGPIMLDTHYQYRKDDYYAFILFPLPWPPRREANPGFVRGAVHISFREKGDLGKIWPILEGPPGAQGRYPIAKPVLSKEWCPDPNVRRTINAHLVVLSELLSGFNEVIYRNYIGPTENH